jgi:TatD DNase family protein
MFIDIHAHINNERCENEVAEVVSRAKNANVEKIVCVGCDVESCKSALELSEKFENVYASIGIHPNNVLEYTQEVETLLRSAKNNKKVVAIGEIGLDYYDLDWQLDQVKHQFPEVQISKEEFIAKQKEVFIKQLELANEIGLPIMIHMRDATSDTLKILEENPCFVENGGLMHCYSEGKDWVQRFLDLGMYISFSGNITYKKSDRSFLKDIPLDKILVETDAPYLTPEPFRGKRNKPEKVRMTAKMIAGEIGISYEEFDKIVTKNAKMFYFKMK